MLQPPYLRFGDKVAIISTARKISKAELNPSISLFKSWGLEVQLGENLFNEDNQFAGNEKERAEDLQKALDDREIRAIFFARGGYGSVQIVDLINWDNFASFPKWLIGFSDVTVFHSHINSVYNIETMHSWMPISLVDSKTSEEAINSLKQLLFAGDVKFQWTRNKLNTFNNEVEGDLVGGNLSILYSLTGSGSQMNLEDKILFIEDLDEYLYHIDRMMMNLKRSNLLEGCKAVIVGGMSDMNDNTIPYGSNAKEIVRNRLNEINIPVVFDFPAGHIYDNRALIFGRRIKLESDNNICKLIIHGRA